MSEAAVQSESVRGFDLVPIETMTGDWREKLEKLASLGGDPAYFQFASNSPEMIEFYWGAFYRDIFFAGSVPVRTKEIARLRLAGLNGCSFCQIGDRMSALDNGLTDVEVESLLDGDGQSESFTRAEQAVADAAGICSNFDPDGEMSAELLSRLQGEFAPAQLVELLMVMSVLTGTARMLVATGFISRTCPVD
ncbi:MAG TPA: carboxymuconolactone decarboxylase family protein [Marmoricola sp.]|jgi:AhpD family alkylhydroperoxidase|nr:carboxymuconolactone decarboxylase family protein [Marmoricola sp.]